MIAARLRESGRTSTGPAKLKTPCGTRTAFTRSNRCAASSTPRIAAETITTGIAAASTRTAARASPCSPTGTFSACRTSQGASVATAAAPVAPSANIAASPVQTSGGISSSRPLASRLATAWVSARPSPRSKRLKYPSTAHARVRSPKRAVPSSRVSTGMAK